MNNLLITEPPLQVLPSLAVKVGLNEAIVLQQFHYWLQRSKKERDGRKWIYNTYAEWNKQFPFWGERTLRRAINGLEKAGYLITANYNAAGFDKTKWYSIDYDKLVASPSGQNGQTSRPYWPAPTGQNDQTNTNRLPETTTEITKDNSAVEKTAPEQPTIPYQKIIDYLNEKSQRSGRACYRNTTTNQKLIRARFKEGFTAVDFKAAIDHCVTAWLHDTKMAQYLRPSTIFAPSKFENYVTAVPAVFSNNNYGKKPVRQESLPDYAQPGYQPPKPIVTDEQRAAVKQRLARLQGGSAPG
jgi:uncharacterized phage protein (TIGR02220 family)